MEWWVWALRGGRLRDAGSFEASVGLAVAWGVVSIRDSVGLARLVWAFAEGADLGAR